MFDTTKIKIEIAASGSSNVPLKDHYDINVYYDKLKDHAEEESMKLTYRERPLNIPEVFQCIFYAYNRLSAHNITHTIKDKNITLVFPEGPEIKNEEKILTFDQTTYDLTDADSCSNAGVSDEDRQQLLGVSKNLNRTPSTIIDMSKALYTANKLIKKNLITKISQKIADEFTGKTLADIFKLFELHTADKHKDTTVSE